MSLQMILGSAQADHLKAIALKAKQAHENGQTVFIIVPNSMKFDLEVAVLKQLEVLFDRQDGFAATNIQILSFTRLAWYLMQNCQGQSHQAISNSGLIMKMYALVKEYADRLLIFDTEIEKVGFLEKIVDLFQEFSLAGITVEHLLNYAKENDENDLAISLKKQAEKAPLTFDQYQALTKKVHVDDLKWKKWFDFIILYQQFLQFTKEYDIGESSILDDLFEWLNEDTTILQNTTIILTGFYQLVSKELQLVYKMSARADVWVDLIGEEVIMQREDNSFFFYPTQRLYRRLKPLTHHVEILSANEQGLAANLVRHYEYQEPLEKVGESLWEAADTYQEIEKVARQIQQLVADEGYRYRDIRIITRQLSTYSLPIHTIFEKYGIPYHIGESQTMANHPLVTGLMLVNHLMTSNNWNAQAVLPLMKLGLYTPVEHYDDIVMQLDNYWYTQCPEYTQVLNETITVEDFYPPRELQQGIPVWVTQTVQQMNEVCRDYFNVLTHLQKRLKEADTYHDYIVAYCEFFRNIDLPTQLQRWFSRDAEMNIEQARRHKQVWESLMNLLEEADLLLGQVKIQSFKKDLPNFQDIILEGVKNSTFSQIPSTLDQVQIVDANRQVNIPNEISFIIGFNNKVTLPDAGLLSNKERQAFDEFLEAQGEAIYLEHDNIVRQNNEGYFAYMSMALAKKRLYMSYAVKTEGEHVAPSKIIQPLLEEGLLAKVYVQRLPKQLAVFDEAYVATKNQYAALYAQMQREMKEDQRTLANEWKTLAKIVAYHPVLQNTYSHQPTTIGTDVAQVLYLNQQGDLTLSMSRAEKFNACQYHYFLENGLKLKERRKFTFERSDSGSLMHLLLEKMRDKLTGSPIELAEMKQQLMEVIQQLNLKDYHLDVHDARQYQELEDLSERMIATLYLLNRQLQEAKENGISVTSQLEYAINRQEIVQGVRVNGRIDRLDNWKDENGQAHRLIIDYKSSKKDFDFTKTYYGLQLQMSTYLKLLNDDTSVLGMAYMALVNLYQDQETLTKLSDYKLRGLWNTSDSLSDQMAKFECVQGMKGQGKKHIDDTQLEDLRQFTVQQYETVKKDMLSGEIKLNPYKSGGETACQYCPFKSVCQFDPMLKDDHYRRLTAIKEKQFYDKIQQGGDRDEA